MITVTRLDGEEILVNPSLIEFIEATPDTVISMATGKKMMIRESIGEVVERIIAYYQRLGHLPSIPPYHPATDNMPNTDVL